MQRRFVIEAVLVAIYGQLMQPNRPVEYIFPYSTIMELYELQEGDDPVMPDPVEDRYVRDRIKELIRFFEDPFNKKKLERALQVPWRMSAPLLAGDNVSFVVMNAYESAQYGELFDPVETEILLTSLRVQAPIVTDQVEFTDKVIEAEVPVEIYDIEDFDYALEDKEDLGTL